MRDAKSDQPARTPREYVERRLALGDKPAEIYRRIDRAFPAHPPARSTVYLWATQWDQARRREKSEPWTLATDQTGRPDVVLSVLTDVQMASRGRIEYMTVAEAEWCVRLAAAVPGMLEDPQGVVTAPDADLPPPYGTLEVWKWAVQYLIAETAGDAKRLHEIDSHIALVYSQWGHPEFVPGFDDEKEG